MKRKIKTTSIVTLMIFLIAWLILSVFYEDDFWCVTFKDWVTIVLTIVIGIIIAYVLNEKNTNKKLFFNVYVTQLNELRDTLKICKNTIFNDYWKKDFKAIILSNNKVINNAINLLSKHSKIMQVEEEFEFIRLQYSEFKVATTEYTDSLKEEENRIKSSLKIDLIISKLNEIELKLFEVL